MHAGSEDVPGNLGCGVLPSLLCSGRVSIGSFDVQSNFELLEDPIACW